MREDLHVITAAPFTPVNMEPIFLRAQELRFQRTNPETRRQTRKEMAQKYAGGMSVNLFYQESTRTRISFELAEVAWGLAYSTTTSARQFSSAAKGETLAHTVEVIEEYDPDFVVLRYDEVGGAAEAASLINIPVINAGDGPGEHPTQAIGDTLTIWEQLGKLDNLRITFMGDLRFGRTVRSLIHILSKAENNHFDFVSTPDLSLSEDIIELLDQTPGITYDEHHHVSALGKILPETDAFYVTRTQTNLGAPDLTTNEFRVTRAVADLLPHHAILLHPMPIDRKDSLRSEVAPEVDDHPRARFYRQAGNCYYGRLVIIEKIMEGQSIIEQAA